MKRTEIPFKISITIQAALLTKLRDFLRYRHSVFFRDAYRRDIKDIITALRYFREKFIGL